MKTTFVREAERDSSYNIVCFIVTQINTSYLLQMCHIHI